MKYFIMCKDLKQNMMKYCDLFHQPLSTTIFSSHSFSVIAV